MTDLAKRAEQAGAEETRALLEEAWLAIHHGGYPPENSQDTCRKCDQFTRFLDAEAYTDAALILVPEGGQWAFDSHHNIARVFVYFDGPQGPAWDEFSGEANTPALALLAAICRARGGE